MPEIFFKNLQSHSREVLEISEFYADSFLENIPKDWVKVCGLILAANMKLARFKPIFFKQRCPNPVLVAFKIINLERYLGLNES